MTSEIVELLSKYSETEIQSIVRDAGLLRKIWPKAHTIYVHGDEDSNYEDGKKLGLTDEVISNVFRGTAYELELTCEVYEDGTCVLLGIAAGGRRETLVDPLRI